MSAEPEERSAIEVRFASVFAHAGFIAAFARRRGARDPEAVAAEVMAIAWRRLADVPRDDPRPWLIATARHVMLAEYRRQGPVAGDVARFDCVSRDPSPVRLDLDPELREALLGLTDRDREALLLVAWEDLTPSLAAATLGISPAAFRVRLHRARRRLTNALGERGPGHQPVDLPPTRLEQS